MAPDVISLTYRHPTTTETWWYDPRLSNRAATALTTWCKPLRPTATYICLQSRSQRSPSCYFSTVSYASWALGMEVTLWGKISILLALFSYRLLSAQFNFIERFDPKTVCKSQNYDIMNVYGFYNIITDFALVDAHAGALESSDEAGERELELLLSLQPVSCK